jgi:hypothetical protein
MGARVGCAARARGARPNDHRILDVHIREDLVSENQEEGDALDGLPSKVVYDVKCTLCPGDGVIRGARPGIDWPTPCPCKARKQLTNYQVGKILEESPRSILNIDRMRAKGTVAERVISKFEKLFPFWRRGS